MDAKTTLTNGEATTVDFESRKSQLEQKYIELLERRVAVLEQSLKASAENGVRIALMITDSL